MLPYINLVLCFVSGLKRACFIILNFTLSSFNRVLSEINGVIYSLINGGFIPENEFPVNRKIAYTFTLGKDRYYTYNFYKNIRFSPTHHISILDSVGHFSF